MSSLKSGPSHWVGPPQASLDRDGGGPHDGGMETRVAKLEAVIPTLATKADMAELRSDFHKSTNELIKWIVGTAFVGIALFITIMAFVLNNAVPKVATPSGQPAPIVIQVPAPPPQPAPNP